jgi:hypothetical protein
MVILYLFHLLLATDLFDGGGGSGVYVEVGRALGRGTDIKVIGGDLS